LPITASRANFIVIASKRYKGASGAIGTRLRGQMIAILACASGQARRVKLKRVKMLSSLATYEGGHARPRPQSNSSVASYLASGLSVSHASAVDRATLLPFSLASLGVRQTEFLDLVLPYHSGLKWDFYDVRRDQINEITSYLEAHSAEGSPNELFLEFYSGKLSLTELLSSKAMSPLPQSVIRNLQSMLPFRKKAATTYHCSFVETGTSSQVSLQKVPAKLVVQDVKDIRSLPRAYPESDGAMIEHPLFRFFLERICAVLKEVDPSVLEMEMTLWQTSLVARQPSTRAGENQRVPTNAPEGIHQDGADYIVSALVLEKTNVVGAESRVYLEDDLINPIYRQTLEPGQGILQSDNNSPLWHTVTPVELLSGYNEGVRNSVGFDFHVIKRA
jgi:hypothetical protein